MFRRSYATSAELEARGGQPESSNSTAPAIAALHPDTIMEVEEEPTTAYFIAIEAPTPMDVERGPAAAPTTTGPTPVESAQASSAEESTDSDASRMSSVVQSLFPAGMAETAPGLKRLSLSSSVGSLPKRGSMIPTHHRRASHSPQRQHQRSISLNGSSSDNASLLGVPVAAQLHALKARNTTLEATLSNHTAQHQAAMFKATSRIASLEKVQLEGNGQLAQDAEGWEAEAQRLQLELDNEPDRVATAVAEIKGARDKVEYELELEKSKKRTYKFLCAKLRCELHNRKGKEKWDLGVMDAADRSRDINEVQLEATIATLRMELGIAKVDIEESEETITRQRQKISALSASRAMLLDSVNASESTIDSLRAEIAAARTDASKGSKAVQKELQGLKGSLRKTEADLKEAHERCAELESSVDEVSELKAEIKGLKSEVARLEKGEKKSEAKEAKELVEAKKMLEKEKTKREKLEGEAKELKTTLKQTQIELKDAQRMAAAASKQKSAVALLPSVATLASRKRRSLTTDGSDPVEEAETTSHERIGEENEEQSEVEEKKQRKSSKKAAAVASDSDNDHDAEVYRPQKSRSRTVALPQKTKAIIAAATAAAGDSVRETSATSAAATTTKKRKMLGDKSSNVSPKKAKNGDEEVFGMSWKKKEKLADKPKPTIKLRLEEAMTEQAAEDGDEKSVAPKKKKKRTLFGGAGKFAWSSIENADVNSLGLPSHLSPIKGGGGAAGLGLGGNRPASTLGILGRGLSGGRKSIFS